MLCFQKKVSFIFSSCDCDKDGIKSRYIRVFKHHTQGRHDATTRHVDKGSKCRRSRSLWIHPSGACDLLLSTERSVAFREFRAGGAVVRYDMLRRCDGVRRRDWRVAGNWVVLRHWAAQRHPRINQPSLRRLPVRLVWYGHRIQGSLLRQTRNWRRRR